MKKPLIYIIILLFVSTSSFMVQAKTKKLPVAHLFKINGLVEYSKPGKKWRKVRRNKIIFDGTRVRTQADASVKILDQETNTILALQAQSEISIENRKINLVSGKLTKEKDVGNLMKGLQKRFKTSQKYATVRRAAKKKKKLKLLTSNITLSSDYPELVWENLGDDYEYKIHVGGQTLEVPESEQDVVRFKVPTLTEGENAYTIDALEDDEVVTSSKPKKINWMSEADRSQVNQQVKSIQEIDSEGFLLGNYLEEQGLLVPALDQYAAFFENSEDDPDDNQMRPLLIQVYALLKLNKLRHEEVKIYNEIKFESE